MSRRKDDNGHSTSAGLASPRQILGSNLNAEASSSSVGSAGNKGRRSFAADFSDPSFLSAEAQSSQDWGSKEMRDGREEHKGLTGWIKSKYHQAKENAEQRRNKSPPADRGTLGASGLLPVRGKSLDIRRPTEEEKQGSAAMPKTPQ